jgi:hypothetical protein
MNNSNSNGRRAWITNAAETIAVPVDSVQFMSIEQLRNDKDEEVNSWAIIAWLKVVVGDKPNFIKLSEYDSNHSAKRALRSLLTEMALESSITVTPQGQRT